MKLIGIISISILFSLIKVSYEQDIAEDAWKLEKNVVMADNCEFPDKAFKSVVNKDNKCGPVCEKNSGCTHWSYDGKKCNLKKGKSHLSLAVANDTEGSACGFNPKYCTSVAMCKRQRVDQANWNFNEKWLSASNCDFADVDMRKMNLTDDADNKCAKACDKASGCTHWTYIKKSADKDGVCKMKKGTVTIRDALDIGAAETIEEQACGFSAKACPTLEKCLIDVPSDSWTTDDDGFVIAPGCDFKTANIKSVASKDGKCGKLCEDLKGCTHFTFKSGKCNLKKGDEITINDAIPGKETDTAKQNCGFTKKTCTDLTVCQEKGLHV